MGGIQEYTTNVTISIMDQIFSDLIGKSLKELFKDRATDVPLGTRDL